MAAKPKRVATGLIKPNPLNPRLFFREEEMDALKESISNLGILVPLVVYEGAKDGQYTLLDGERRLKCAQELGLKTVPVNVTPAPTDTENILMMFNIHSLREQWDAYTIAIALDALMKALGTRSSRELSTLTGFSVGSINRSKKLLRLSPQYLEMLREELAKPKSRQSLTEDFFLELSDAVSAIRRHQPALYGRYGDGEIMDQFVDRRQRGGLKDIVDLRVLADVANFEKSGLSQEKSYSILERAIEKADLNLSDVYAELVEHNKAARTLISQIRRLNETLSEIIPSDLNATTAEELKNSLDDLQRTVRSVRTKLADL